MSDRRDFIDVQPREETAAERQRAEIGVPSSIPAEELGRITGDVIRALKTVFDPEIPVDIYELGLVYKVDLSDERVLTIDMTLTAPGCPVAGEMPGWVENAVSLVPGVADVNVNMHIVMFPVTPRPMGAIGGDPHILRAGRDYPIWPSSITQGYVEVDRIAIEFPS